MTETPTQPPANSTPARNALNFLAGAIQTGRQLQCSYIEAQQQVRVIDDALKTLDLHIVKVSELTARIDELESGMVTGIDDAIGKRADNMLNFVEGAPPSEG